MIARRGKKGAVGVNTGIVLVTAALFVSISAFVAFTTSHMMENEARNTVDNVVKTAVGRIDTLMTGVESAVNNSAWVVGEHLNEPDYMFRITRELVTNNAFIVGSAIAFEADYFKAKGKGRLFAPYSCDTTNGIRVAQLEYDYLVHRVERPELNEWFWKAKAERRPRWCEPYFDEGGGNILMSTYSVPLLSSDGRVYAILTADISLEGLTREVAKIRPYPGSYATLRTRDEGGNVLVGAPKEMRSEGELLRLSGTAANGWVVELACPLETILRDAHRLVLRIVLFSLVGLGLIFFVSWSFSSRLQRMTAANARIRSELAIASQIQATVLNRAFSEKIHADLLPAKEVGGDLYDFAQIGGRLYFTIGDASGKGVPAALFAFRAGAGFRLGAEMGLAPAEIVTRINDLLVKDNETSMFVTLFVGVLDSAAGTFSWCNAGHNPLVVVQDGKAGFLKTKRNVPVAVMEDYRYKGEEMPIASGTKLLLYTDGVTEAMRADDEQFGDARLLAFAAAHAADGVQALTEGLRRATEDFVAGAEQSDDITVLAVEA